jgi:hypothetical protein
MVLTLRRGRIVEARDAKYGNTRAMYRGRAYDSKAEMKYAMLLDAEVANGRVANWQSQYPLPIFHNGIDICTYYADFRVQYADGHVEFVDVKGVRTDIYRLKKKLVRAFHGIIIKEVRSKDL